jgi:hypothetical protein
MRSSRNPQELVRFQHPFFGLGDEADPRADFGAILQALPSLERCFRRKRNARNQQHSGLYASHSTNVECGLLA